MLVRWYIRELRQAWMILRGNWLLPERTPILWTVMGKVLCRWHHALKRLLASILWTDTTCGRGPTLTSCFPFDLARMHTITHTSIQANGHTFSILRKFRIHSTSTRTYWQTPCTRTTCTHTSHTWSFARHGALCLEIPHWGRDCLLNIWGLPLQNVIEN